MQKLLRPKIPSEQELIQILQRDQYYRVASGTNSRCGLLDIKPSEKYRFFFDGWRNSLTNIKIETDPWPHCVKQDFLPTQLYQKLIKTLPKKPKPESSPSRTWVTFTSKFFLTGESEKFKFFSHEEANWWGKDFILPLSNIISFFVDRTSFLYISENFKKFSPSLLELGEDETIIFQVRLNHDRDDYNLDVHLDHPEKLLSIILYLPIDESSQNGGTSLYRPIDENLEQMKRIQNIGYKYFDKSLFNFEKKIPFSPNTGFVFLRTDESWHAKPLDSSDFRPDRFTLQINYFKYTWSQIQQLENGVVLPPRAS